MAFEDDIMRDAKWL